MIPNRFPDGGEAPEYNAADASLWMVVAIHRLTEASGDHELARKRMKGTVAAILDGYKAGTRHGIRMVPEALLEQGAPGLQLTWMDAKVGDWVVTPRRGYAVEIQALWYNALLIGADLARETGEAQRASEWAALAGRVRESFLRAFWSESLGYLADVVAGGTKDLSLRPNQLYAIGLPHALLPRDKALRVLDVVKRHLLTPFGLRTLAPSDPQYQGRYEGGPRTRDGAYHQGTAWPFLMGIYFDAVIRLYGEEGKAAAREWLAGFAPHLREAGLGTVSEVFDGDPPHRPGGTIAQAWSVAELLRIAERLDLRRPRYPPREGEPPL
jgi:predicted glycogen debranching enzyme